MSLIRIALGIEYCGAHYCGWQSQPSGCGIQDHLEHALGRFLDQPVQVVCAGRTDAGVHAWGQVVHLETELHRSNDSWVRGTNAFLPPDVRVLWAQPVSETFHARRSALSRTYQYWLLNDAMASAALASRVGWFHQPLDAEKMHSAAALLLGEHDFSAFRAAGCQAKSPVKTLYEASVYRRGEYIGFEFRGNAFLHHMVRNMVGGLVYVGSDRISLNEFKALLDQRDRRLAPPTFSADGLYLANVEYDAVFAIPAARARRFP